MNQFTVEKIVKMMVSTNQPQEALRLFRRASEQGLPSSYNTLNLVLQASLKLLDLETIIKTLKEFHARKREP